MRIIFVDETHFDEKVLQTHAFSRKGVNIYAQVKPSSSDRLHLLAAVSAKKGVEAYLI